MYRKNTKGACQRSRRRCRLSRAPDSSFLARISINANQVFHHNNHFRKRLSRLTAGFALLMRWHQCSIEEQRELDDVHHHPVVNEQAKLIPRRVMKPAASWRHAQRWQRWGIRRRCRTSRRSTETTLSNTEKSEADVSPSDTSKTNR